MLNRRLSTATPFGVFRILKPWANFLILVGSMGGADCARGQDSPRAVPDSAVNALQKSSRDLWLGKDKFDHALASAGLVAAQFYLLHQELDVASARSRQIAVSGTLLLGVAKEIYDAVSHRGTPSWKDLVADLVGAGLAAGIMTQ